MNLRGYIGARLFVLLLGVGGLFVLSAPAALAQTPVCTTAEQKAACQSQYDQLQQEIAQYQKIIDDTKAKEKNLQGDVTTLNAQIAKAQAEIKQRNVTIGQLQTQITQKAATVQTLQQRLEASEASLGKLLRERNEADVTPLAVLALSSGSLSDFFGDVTDIDTLNGALRDKMDELSQVKAQTQAEKDALAKQQDSQEDARYGAQILQKQVTATKQEKTNLLTVTKGQEDAYNKVLAQKQAQATAIRNALFNLRDTGSVTFEAVLTYATLAEQKTGVRAALILGILRQESNLGSNVGQCYLTNSSTGAGKNKNTGKVLANVMNPTRDVPPFINLMSRLGVDPYSQVVSCPQSVGYGGAMGPSQFIASTWKLYENRIETATGSGIADPWSVKDAVMATALYMDDLGAGAQTYSAERKAAGTYYAGSRWATLGLTYANSVLSYAEQYQNNIDFLKDNNL